MTERRSNNAKGPSLARRLGLFDATMIVMGGIIGAGIFVNPSVVAQRVNTPALVLCAWLIGGLIALIGAFVYAELAALRPGVGRDPPVQQKDAKVPAVDFRPKPDMPLTPTAQAAVLLSEKWLTETTTPTPGSDNRSRPAGGTYFVPTIL